MTILTRFIDKHIVIVLKDMTSQSQDENGHVVDMPVVCEGILYDFDEHYLLIGNEHESAFSLLNHNSIVKIDLIDERDLVMMDPDRPDYGDMN